MIELILYFTHYSLLLLFGILLSFSFSGIHLSKKSVLHIVLLFIFCGLLQLFSLYQFGENITWKIYPFITHLPLVITLCIIYKKNILTVISSITTAYLFCQPAKWMNMFFTSISDNENVGRFIAIIVLVLSCLISIHYISVYISEIYNKQKRDILVFGFVPCAYYIMDYFMNIYTELWIENIYIIAEFLPFFLCIVFVLFCVTYYKEYEKRMENKQREQIINITLQQQANEIETIKKSSLETRLLRHDLRLLLENLALSIEKEDKENSLKMIKGYISNINSTVIQRYCENDTLNYILSNYEKKCRDNEIMCHFNIMINELNIDETMFASIISNALDNAINAQYQLPKSKRSISLIIKTVNNKLLLSIQNPYKIEPKFENGLPITSQKGHGYGTQSIRYMSEKLGGKCQFSIQENHFVVRVII